MTKAGSTEDFRLHIRENLRIFPGITDYPECIDSLNDILNELKACGFCKLVERFRSQTDPDKACDILFEIWLCLMLRRNHDVRGLHYEPRDTAKPPDFRFYLHGVDFDVQVKRIYNRTTELITRLFERVCARQLSTIRRPWLINFWVSDHFEKRHFTPFLTRVQKSIDTFRPVTTYETLLGRPAYSWKENGRTLVRFSFSEVDTEQLGILPGVISLEGTANGLMRRVDPTALRKGIRSRLRKSGRTLVRRVCPTQANLVVMQTVGFLIDTNEMCEALYGSPYIRVPVYGNKSELRRKPDGLFCRNQFQNICGLVLVDPSVWIFDERFKGQYFCNPFNIDNINCHPSPFEDMQQVRP